MNKKILPIILIIVIVSVTAVVTLAFFNHTVTIEKIDENGKTNTHIIYGLTESHAKMLFLELSLTDNNHRSLETTADVTLEEMQYNYLQKKIRNWCDKNPDASDLRYDSDETLPKFVLWCWNEEKWK